MAKAKKTAKPKMGRPPSGDLDDPEVVERLMARICAGESILTICKDKDMPAESTVYLRMARDEDFRRAIAHARDAQQDREVDQTVALADEATPGNWQVKKLQIWARQWRASKLAAKKYGDFQRTELSTPEDRPLKVDMTITPAEAYARALKR